MSIKLYQYLTTYGSVYETGMFLNDPKKFVDWTEENFEYVRYNPRFGENRYGLSITSLDGSVSGVPDLDSLTEYAKETGKQYREEDFTTFTPVAEYEDLKIAIAPIRDHIVRSHILKIEQGGFFPPHRDVSGFAFDNFRLIVPLKSMDSPDFNFIMEDKILSWKTGRFYFLDTAKMHYLFNLGKNPSYMIVFNVRLDTPVVKYITSNLKYYN